MVSVRRLANDEAFPHQLMNVAPGTRTEALSQTTSL